MQQASWEHLQGELLLGVISGVEEQVVCQQETGHHDEGLHYGCPILHVS